MGAPSARTCSSMSALRDELRSRLQYTLGDCLLPELGVQKKGKVRDIYFSSDKVVMVASDRVSAFDCVLDALVPYKGMILNSLTRWAFERTRDIVPNALISDTADPNVVVQKQMKNLNVECIVRGYMWGSLAAAYEKGDRTFCGLKMEDGLLRYQKFPTPIFTPTTKAEEGDADENMTFEEVVHLIGNDKAQKIRDISLKLFERGTQLAKNKGLILIDTKYEFGLDENDQIHVIDEVNTPDSSRLCDAEEYEQKWNQIKTAMNNQAPKVQNVSKLMEAQPDLKITEFSKQYVRDVLIESGFKPGKSKAPTLTEEQVVECALRYIQVYERITGETWRFPDASIAPERRIVFNLQKHKIIKGCMALLFAGSDSDATHLKAISSHLSKGGVPHQIRICSAHKQSAQLEGILHHYNKSIEPLMIIACAGGTDALSGTASYHSVYPVVSCPPDGRNETCLSNPPGSSNAFILRPDNLAKFCLQTFSLANVEFRRFLLEANEKKIASLRAADARYLTEGEMQA